MGLFAPKWLEFMSPDMAILHDYSHQLEGIRRKYDIPNKEFGSYVLLAPIGVMEMFNLHIRPLKRKNPNMSEREIYLIAYPLMIGVVNGAESPANPDDQFPNLIRRHANRIHTMSTVCQSPDDVLRLLIMEEGLYTDTSFQERTLLKEIDLACHWTQYEAIGHLPPAHPKPDFTLSPVDGNKVFPFFAEMAKRIAVNSESIVMVAYDIGQRAGVHPYHVILFWCEAYAYAKTQKG